jgi:hypothetical protein
MANNKSEPNDIQKDESFGNVAFKQSCPNLVTSNNDYKNSCDILKK